MIIQTAWIATPLSKDATSRRTESRKMTHPPCWSPGRRGWSPGSAWSSRRCRRHPPEWRSLSSAGFPLNSASPGLWKWFINDSVWFWCVSISVASLNRVNDMIPCVCVCVLPGTFSRSWRTFGYWDGGGHPALPFSSLRVLVAGFQDAADARGGGAGRGAASVAQLSQTGVVGAVTCSEQAKRGPPLLFHLCLLNLCLCDGNGRPTWDFWLLTCITGCSGVTVCYQLLWDWYRLSYSIWQTKTQVTEVTYLRKAAKIFMVSHCWAVWRGGLVWKTLCVYTSE